MARSALTKSRDFTFCARKVPLALFIARWLGQVEFDTEVDEKKGKMKAVQVRGGTGQGISTGGVLSWLTRFDTSGQLR